MDRSWPVLGCGIGLRSKHYPDILDKWPAVDWFEAVSENYMDTGGRPVRVLEQVRRHYPVALHGTALSIGSTDPLNAGYLKRLKVLADRIDPFIVSDHLCWSGVGGKALHDLLPLPYTPEALKHVVSRIHRIQETLGRPILVENVSTYVTYRHSEMAEWEFIAQVSARSGCGILLDLNNIYVNSVNHKFKPEDYLSGIPWERVGQVHLAGFTDMLPYLLDTHSAPVVDTVWELYKQATRCWGKVSTLIEWDENIPELSVLLDQAAKARVIYDAAPDASKCAAAAPKTSGTVTVKKVKNPKAAGKGTALAEVQRSFQARMLPGTRSERIAALFNPQGGSPGVERMSVYAGGYLARVHESLAEVFETIHNALGEETFSALCRSYIQTYPSTHYNLNNVGKHLPEYIASLPLQKEAPYLADLARLEWLVWEAFHAFDGEPITPQAIAGVALEDWDKAKIVFQPSVRLFRSPWSLLKIWLERESPDSKARPKKGEEGVLIGRKGDQVRCEIIGTAQHKLIGELLAGKTLGAACAKLAEDGDGEHPIAEWFGLWMRDGLIARCEFPKKPVRRRTVAAARS